MKVCIDMLYFTCSVKHFRHPTDEQLQHSYIFSNYYNLQSVHFEYVNTGI